MFKAPFVIATCAALSSTSIWASERPEPDPANYLWAFNDTCRRGFPDLDAIAAQASASGWQESTMSLADGSADIFSASLPRAFHKDGLMLFLTPLSGGSFKLVCQITGSQTTRLTGADIVAIVSPSLKAGPPVITNNAEGEKAVWTVAPSISVEAGISIYRRKVRTLSIAARQIR